jgi:hypothetical protein
MLAAQILLPLDGVALDHVELHDHDILVHAHSIQQVAACPACQTPSTRPPSWYTRTLADAVRQPHAVAGCARAPLLL